MSDLTRPNPTPHAIAVYASQPLSPVATQHSLPSRTLPFTWAGLSPAGSHQLCLAHVAVGTCVSSHAPLTEPYVRLSRIRLPPRVCDRKLTYAFQRLWHAYPVLRPARALLARISLGPRPSLPRLR